MNEITRTPDVQGGEPCIAGTRTPVRSIVQYIRLYQDIERIERSLPHLNRAQIHTAVWYYLCHQAEIDAIIHLNDEAGEALKARG